MREFLLNHSHCVCLKIISALVFQNEMFWNIQKRGKGDELIFKMLFYRATYNDCSHNNAFKNLQTW
jgi:hypothetical protein